MNGFVPPALAWKDRITTAWRKGVEAILDTAFLLIEAKKALPHGEWQKLIADELPFKARTAEMLMEIGRDERLAKPQTIALLPPEWSTMHSYTKLDDEAFEKALLAGDSGTKVRQAVKTGRRETRERDLGAKQRALPDAKFGVILADPEWRFEPWSRSTGLDRAADNHYPTSCTDVIASRDVRSIAANDCALFLWATVPMLPHALLVMAAWGFDYRSSWTWIKTNSAEESDLAIGTGYWNRNAHEYLLLGVRGHPPAPSQGTQYPSVIHAMVGEHSAKPEVLLRLIEDYFPTLPKIELNRRGAARPGWTPWGNEAIEQESAPSQPALAGAVELAPVVDSNPTGASSPLPVPDKTGPHRYAVDIP